VIPEQEDPAHREILFGSYRIMYHVSDQRVLLTRIIHGAREIESLARKPWSSADVPVWEVSQRIAASDAERARERGVPSAGVVQEGAALGGCSLDQGDFMANDVSTKNLILVPAVITLAVTLLRLTGELLHWSPVFFNPAAGGGGAIVGIAWLVPVFGVYFGLKLAKAGLAPAALGPAIGYAVLGFALMPALGFAASKLGVPDQSLSALAVFAVLALIGAAVAYRGWPVLGRTLLAYGLAARVPVVIVMLVAMLGNWGTHYDVAPPNFPEMSPIAKWLLIGVVPQMTVWIWFTMVVGAIFGTITAAVVRRSRRPAAA
jgi:hypothetical protein